jgi:ribosome-associated translation inhibitor RaiA
MFSMDRLNDEVSMSLSSEGEVEEADLVAAREKVEALAHLVREPVLAIEVRLIHQRDPANERPYSVELVFDVEGRPVRAHAAAAHMREAVDVAVGHLHRRIERAQSRRHRINQRRETGVATSDEWQHGDLPTTRPHFFSRPVDERDLVRRKTFALEPITVDEAAFDLDQSGHDFYLFNELQTGADCVLHRGNGGELELLCAGDSSPDLARATVPIHRKQSAVGESSVEAAKERLNLANEPFVFFRSAQNGRGQVLYRRRDGHYGLIVGA